MKQTQTKQRYIRRLIQEELENLIEKSKLNSIEISGICVHSTIEPLKKVEATIDRLITKHKDFVLLRKEQKLKTGFE